MTVLLQRRPTWLPTLIDDLAERLRFDSYDRGPFEVVDGLRRGLGLAPPATPAFVFLWAVHRWSHDYSSRAPQATGAAAITAEPAVAGLIPLIFDEEGAAWLLRS